MKFLSRILLLSLTFGLLATLSQTAIAQKYVSKADGFSIAFVGKPIIEKSNTKTVDGNIEFRIYSVKTATAFFALSVSNVPSGLDAETSQIVLQNVLADETGNGSVLAKRTVATSGHNGIEADIKQSNFIKRGRYYILNDKLYQIVVAGAGNYYKSAAAVRFLNSLAFLDGSAKTDSRQFVSNECGFSVDFSKVPVKEVVPIKTVPNKYVRSFTVSSPNKTQMIVCVDLTPERMGGGIEATIDSFYNETIADGDDVQIIEKKSAALEGYEGIEYTAKKQGSHRRGRVFIVGTHLLSIYFIGTKTVVASDDATTYLDSLKLIKRTVATK